MKIFHVVLGTKHIDLVQAQSEEHAIKIIETIFGPSRKYSRVHQYRAVRA
jgi:hypothetical protein